MPCDTKLKAGQTITQRKEEITQAVARVQAALVAGRVTLRVGPTGGAAFIGVTAEERNDVTDACMYRRIMATGSALAKAKIAAAEALQGRSVSKQAIGQGHHSHDSGRSWHTHKG